MVGHTVLDKLHRPFVAHLVKEPANVRIQHPFHSLPMESHTQRIQRLVWAAPRPEPVRKALEVHLINLIENGHHRLLNDFVRQRRDAQRALPPVGLRYMHSSRGLCPVRTTVNPAVQIGKPTLQPGLILFPSHAIHPGRSLPLQRVKAVPEQIHAQMVEQSSESVPSPFPSRLTHTAQSLGHPFPALCRASVGRSDVLLGPRPSLPYLRRGLSLVVRQVHRCRVGGGALARWPPSAAQTARTVFPYAAFTMRRCYEMQATVLTE